MVRHLLIRCPTIDDTLSTQELALYTRYPVATVARILQDLDVLDVVTKTGTNFRFRWTLSKYIRNTIEKAELYTLEEEVKRKTRVLVKRKKAK
jgi:DNA-binding IclR family transcriptional regulator